jgi:hypothetical protein
MTFIRRLKTSIDAIDVYYGLVPAAAAYAAFVSWASVIVRAIKGEEVEPGWRAYVSTGALMAAFTLVSGTRVRENAALRAAAVEMRRVLQEAAEDAKLREERAAERDRRLTRLTKWLVALAGLTLAAAVVTLAGSILGS